MGKGVEATLGRMAGGGGIGEVGGTGFIGAGGQLPTTVYQDLGETHSS